MIPKIIHYCWFGNNELPPEAKKCITSWRLYFPDYEIKRWDETNFDLEINDYVKEAYAAKKWAFISDYARFKVLFDEGGLYFDTDVEVIENMEEVVAAGPFMGCESDVPVKVASGLGLGAEPGMAFFKSVLEAYDNRHFVNQDGSYDQLTVVDFITEMLIGKAENKNRAIIEKNGIRIYPKSYFCPLDYNTGKLTITPETRTIHHYSASWHSDYEKWIHNTIGHIVTARFGYKTGKTVETIIGMPYQLLVKFRQMGVKNTIVFIMRRLGKS